MRYGGRGEGCHGDVTRGSARVTGKRWVSRRMERVGGGVGGRVVLGAEGTEGGEGGRASYTEGGCARHAEDLRTQQFYSFSSSVSFITHGGMRQTRAETGRTKFKTSPYLSSRARD